MYEIDVDRFRTMPPWRDPSFFVALALALIAFVFDVQDGSVTQASLGVDGAPIGVWLLLHGYVRGKGAEALGVAVAGSRDVVVAPDREHVA